MSDTQPYRILGIDPGTAIIGWGIIDVYDSTSTPQTIAYGHISTHKDQPDWERLCDIAQDLTHIIDRYTPHVAAIEELFYFKNQKTVITVAQARGVIVEKCASHNLEIASYTPLQIKQSLTGYGRADKKQMQDMVTKTLQLPAIPQPDDTADALAVAICHKNSYLFAQKIRQ